MAAPVTLLDASVLPPQEREGATQGFMERFTGLDALWHACPPESIVTRMRAWDLGTLRLDVTECPWLGAELNHSTATEAVSIAAQVSGQTAMVHGGECWAFAPGDISLTDLASPFKSQAGEASTNISFRFSYAELCLPAEAIRSAAGDLAASPLHELFQAHVLQLYRCLEEDIPALAAESLGAATLELARAVIATVGQVEVARNDVANEALVTRIEAYVQQHLADPALSPGSIAHAHQISVRQLYKLWSERELGLAEWIIRGRLEGARHDIAKGGSPGIAAVARQWGFTDPTHFGRRFRAAYGLSPREWRQAQDHQEAVRAAAS
jgi:AraC-like DNA-binding protein